MQFPEGLLHVQEYFPNLLETALCHQTFWKQRFGDTMQFPEGLENTPVHVAKFETLKKNQ